MGLLATEAEREMLQKLRNYNSGFFSSAGDFTVVKIINFGPRYYLVEYSNQGAYRLTRIQGNYLTRSFIAEKGTRMSELHKFLSYGKVPRS